MGSGTLLRDSTGASATSCVSQTKLIENELDRFILSEEIGTAVNPLCGGCKCGKCPVPGQTFSFVEEQELQHIQSCLKYDSENGFWVASYPWTVDPRALPNNYPAAYSTLCRTEKTLARDPAWMATYQLQIEDHIARGVARKLSPDELRQWDGPVFYLSHMAIEQPKSESTPVRLVFNSSQTYRGSRSIHVLPKVLISTTIVCWGHLFDSVNFQLS